MRKWRIFGKKNLVCVIAVVMAMGMLTACGGDDKDKNNTSSSQTLIEESLNDGNGSSEVPDSTEAPGTTEMPETTEDPTETADVPTNSVEVNGDDETEPSSTEIDESSQEPSSDDVNAEPDAK